MIKADEAKAIVIERKKIEALREMERARQYCKKELEKNILEKAKAGENFCEFHMPLWATKSIEEKIFEVLKNSGYIVKPNTRVARTWVIEW